MLNFDEFQEYAKMKIPELIAEKGEQVEVILNHVTKNNGVILHAATVKTEDSCIAPNIYLDGAFKQYEEGADLDELMDKLAETAFSNLKAPEELATVGKDYQNFDFVKDKIIMTVVNAEKNRELLADVPHENREDLAMIYKVMLSKSSQGLATITIRNEHMKVWGVTEAEIHELAMKNTREILPVTVQSMGEVLGEFAGEAGIPEDMNRSLFADMPLDEQMFIISNASKVNGAASIFYEDALSDLADKIGTDLYILPSSVHECIAVSTHMGTPEMLSEMVREVNGSEVAESEQLSDHVYRFDAETRKLSLADTTMEEILAKVSEDTRTYEAAPEAGESSRPHHHR